MKVGYEIIQEAFKGPAASVTCAALGALFAKDNSGYDIESIEKKLKTDQASVWFAVSRLRHEVPVLESFIDYDKKKKLDGKVRVYNKFRVKKEFVPMLASL
jgi:predicted peptidase